MATGQVWVYSSMNHRERHKHKVENKNPHEMAASSAFSFQKQKFSIMDLAIQEEHNKSIRHPLSLPYTKHIQYQVSSINLYGSRPNPKSFQVNEPWYKSRPKFQLGKKSTILDLFGPYPSGNQVNEYPLSSYQVWPGKLGLVSQEPGLDLVFMNHDPLTQIFKRPTHQECDWFSSGLPVVEQPGFHTMVLT